MTWSEMGQQTTQAKEVYSAILQLQGAWKKPQQLTEFT